MCLECEHCGILLRVDCTNKNSACVVVCGMVCLSAMCFGCRMVFCGVLCMEMGVY